MKTIKSTAKELENKLFSSIDKKIKKIALIYFCVITVLGGIAGVIGVLMLAMSPEASFITLLSALIMIVLGYVSACFMYGFGTIVATHVEKENPGDENYDNPV